jgi:hypothetical protein
MQRAIRTSTHFATPQHHSEQHSEQHFRGYTIIPLCRYAVYIKHVAPTGMSGHKRYRGMSNEHNPAMEPSHIPVYQIRIKGHLGPDWADWFDGLAITLQDNGETLLSGPVVDQAALHGLLRKVRDLGMVLISVIGVSDLKQ